MGRKRIRLDPKPPNPLYNPGKAEGPRGLEAQMGSTGSTKAGTGLPNQETTRPNHSPPTQHLPKAESAMFVQLRTGRTGLRHLLSKVQVPGYESEQCNCGTVIETPRHVLLHCPHEEECRIGPRGPIGFCPPIGYSQGSSIGEQVDDLLRKDPPISTSGSITL